MNSAEKIERLVKKVRFSPEASADMRILEYAEMALKQRVNKTQSNGFELNIWRIIMNKPITKLAAAAVIIIAAMIGINQFGGSVDMTSVAWGKIAERIEQIETVSYRMRVSAMTDEEASGQGESVIRQSSQYGMQMDVFEGNKLAGQTYILLREKETIAFFHQSKKYFRKELSEEQQRQGPKIEDPRKWLPSLLSENYQELGRKTIDGVEVEGIEVAEPQFCGRALADCRVQLWVDIENELPVQVVSESIPSKSKMNIRTVFDDFQWNVEFDSSVFQSPVIPDDYTEMQLPKGW